MITVKIGGKEVSPLDMAAVAEACGDSVVAMIANIPASDHAEHLTNITKVQFAFITFLRAHLLDREASGVYDSRLDQFLRDCEESLGLSSTEAANEPEPGIIIP
jgi:hypothetical protein